MFHIRGKGQLYMGQEAPAGAAGAAPSRSSALASTVTARFFHLLIMKCLLRPLTVAHRGLELLGAIAP